MNLLHVSLYSVYTKSMSSLHTFRVSPPGRGGVYRPRDRPFSPPRDRDRDRDRLRGRRSWSRGRRSRSRGRRSRSGDRGKKTDQDKFKGSLSEGMFAKKTESSDEELDV